MCICSRFAWTHQETASSRMDALDGNQLLDRARVILKDDTLAAELIVSAAKPGQLVTDLTSINHTHSDISCYSCSGANHLARYCLSWWAGQDGSRRGEKAIRMVYCELNKRVFAFTANTDVCSAKVRYWHQQGKIWIYLICKKRNFNYTYLSHCGHIKPWWSGGRGFV